MRNIYNSFFTFLLITFCACDSNQPKSDIETFSRSDFKEQIQLKGSPIELPGIFRPRRIKVIPEANLILILESQASEFFATIFSLDSMKFKQHLIKNGYGEGEQLSPMSLQYISSEKRIYVFDHLLQSMFFYSTDSIIKGSDGRANGVYKNPKAQLTSNTNSKIVLNPIITEGNHQIVSVATSLNHESLHLLDMYDQTFNFLYPKGQYPMLKDTFPKYAYREIFLGNLSNPQPNLVIFSHYNTDILSVFDTSGKHIISKQGPDIHKPDFSIINTQGGKTIAPGKKSYLCYMPSVRSINNKLLTLYSGNLISSRNENGTELFLFSESLDPEKYYKLDKKIFDYDIDINKGYLYGLSTENRPHIVVYKL